MALVRRSEKERPIRIQNPKKPQFDRALVTFLGLLTSAVSAFYLLAVGSHVWNAANADWNYHHSADFYAVTRTPTFENARAAHRTKELYLSDERRVLHAMYTKDGWQSELAGHRVVVPWRAIEGVQAILYLAFFSCGAFRIPKRIGDVTNSFIDKNIEVESVLPRPISALGTAAKMVAVFANDSVGLYRAVSYFCVIGFIFFYVVLSGAAYYGVHADSSQPFRILAWGLATVIVALIGYQAFTLRYSNETTSKDRRALLKTAAFGAVSAVALRYLQKAPQIVKLGFDPKPRFKRKTSATRHVAALPPGLYKHVKSNRIYYVDAEKALHAHHPISQKNLVRFSNIGEADFNNLPNITAKAYFETYGIYLLEKARFLDALAVLDLGCTYEILRLSHTRGLKPNIRIFKLYSGLCHRANKKDRLRLLRERIKALGLEAVLQPSPQKWLKSKAWCFKSRWTGRLKYNGHNLTADAR